MIDTHQKIVETLRMINSHFDKKHDILVEWERVNNLESQHLIQLKHEIRKTNLY